MSRRIRQFSLQKGAPSDVEFEIESLIFEVLTGPTGRALTELCSRCLPCRLAGLDGALLAPCWLAGYGLAWLCWLQVHALMTCARRLSPDQSCLDFAGGARGLLRSHLSLRAVLACCAGLLGLLRLSEPGWLF